MSDAEQRAAIFQHMSELEVQLNVSMFAMVLCPDLYCYHKKDSVEFSVALTGQGSLTLVPGCQTFDFDQPAGKIIVTKTVDYHYPWWKALRSSISKTTKRLNWRWFVIVFENTRLLFTAETADFPLKDEQRSKMMNIATVLWEESQLADIEYARDTYRSNIAEVAHIASDEEFIVRYGIRRI